MQHDKHSARVEEAIHDARMSAPAGYRDDARPREDEEDVFERAGVRPDVPAAPGAPDPVDIAVRSELARFLSPRALPGSRDQLLASAMDNDAPEWVRDALAQLPDDRLFDGISALWEAITILTQP